MDILNYFKPWFERESANARKYIESSISNLFSIPQTSAAASTDDNQLPQKTQSAPLPQKKESGPINNSSKKGYIYIIDTPISATLKIGRTKERLSHQAVKDYLHRRYHTAYGNSMTIILFSSKNMFTDEKQIHTILASCRQPTSELFQCTKSKAITICSQITHSSPIY